VTAAPVQRTRRRLIAELLVRVLAIGVVLGLILVALPAMVEAAG
jgi:hypothetical protein